MLEKWLFLNVNDCLATFFEHEIEPCCYNLKKRIFSYDILPLVLKNKKVEYYFPNFEPLFKNFPIPCELFQGREFQEFAIGDTYYPLELRDVKLLLVIYRLDFDPLSGRNFNKILSVLWE